ncbi:MAG TPA: DNA-3-methyladenine glycosylase 2 family protein [Saprospiraceae bacterium]|nr:DNA-3-methyladenine glycosylase 2 family protein [Saprospiraceae bacterium]HPN69119.1 DNA-3-methyladenine glycosylase 2 family protein [Saprospiraceae bacterium]
MEVALKHLRRDPILKELINKVGELPSINQDLNIHNALQKSIVSQQLSTKVADTIFQRYLALNGGELIPEKVVTLEVNEMRSVGLSFQKAGYLKNVSQFFIENPELNTGLSEMSDEELVKKLTSIKGVGEWTVQMLLIFVLNRHDVLPLDDLIVRKGIIFHYGLDEADKKVKIKCTEIAENWRPYRSFASRYMWASKDMILAK